MKKFSIILMMSILFLSACSHQQDKHNGHQSENKTAHASENQNSDNHQKKHKKVVKEGLTYIDGILMVNKTIALPASYDPGENPKAQKALQQLFDDAQKEGMSLYKISGYRSYPTQVELYKSYVQRDGKKAADQYSARPGHSEHQTGLAFDVGGVHSDENLYARFGKTKEGQWIAKHAHQYGFIVRYPKGKENITGYQYEPWHLRYLGKDKATEVYKSGEALEEYLGLK
ncbi:D-alanyl-D-alanine carboxypeptidase family protein [Staphylococcus sp. 17KM0847]|uniref:M15 family metallopeptidase n=1 Tax=Staphylococcus sp. 17KM0847 TaxID=2583989 RepID=UPI0015DC4A38|nr:M15 family metallopeptidase [Staphylococcus sp. 17KM0847]QLK85242.1 D-alanyl-D-alanine carboxypeptidase family protein [Staphylococcus sp. 17KM0847]